jgi:hypothetical protein
MDISRIDPQPKKQAGGPLRRIFFASICGALPLVGCGRSPETLAVIVDKIIVSPRSIPPVRNDFDFELEAIDGRPVERESIPFLEDAFAGAVTTAGLHSFTVSVYPMPRPPHCAAKEVLINATVKAGKRYAIVGAEDAPSLLEYHQP